MKDDHPVPAMLGEILAWGDVARQAGIIPKEMSAIQAAMIVQAGRELGLHPLQSLRSISLVNGRMVMSVQLQLALARSQAGVRLVRIEESADSCTVTLARNGEQISCTYTMDDAKRAGLIRNDGSWVRYPRQMLRWRAIGDALRLIAPDVVMGLIAPEEADVLPLADGAEVMQPVAELGEETAQPTEAALEPAELEEDDSDRSAHISRAKAGAKKLREVFGYSRDEARALRDRWLAEGLSADSFWDVVEACASRADLERAMWRLGIPS